MEVTDIDVFRAEPKTCSPEFLEWLHRGTANTGASAANVGFKNGHRITYAQVVPSNGTHRTGDERENSAPAVGAVTDWMCSEGGTPGTWVKGGTYAT